MGDFFTTWIFLRVCEKGTVPQDKLAEIVNDYMTQAKSYFVEYASLDKPRENLCKLMNKLIEDKGSFGGQDLGDLLYKGYFRDKSHMQDELMYLVRNNFLYYNPTRAEYKMQGRSMEIGLERYVQEICVK